MAVLPRLFLLAFIPILALLTLQSLAPETYKAATHYLQHALSTTPLAPLVPIPRENIHLVFSSVSHWSHHEKLAKIALPLAELGYPITFLTGRIFEDDVASLHPNIKFHAMAGKDDKLTPAEYEELKKFKPGSEEGKLWFMKKIMLETMGGHFATLQEVFGEIKQTGKMIVNVFDLPILAAHVSILGPKGVKPDANLGVSLHPLMLDSNDTFPSYIARRPATGPNARSVHATANTGAEMDFVTRELSRAYWDQLGKFGVTRREDWHIYHAMQIVPQHLMAMGTPEFQFPRTDLRDDVHFFGALKPRKKAESGKDRVPAWWADVESAKRAGKKIVAVSQGTVAPDMNELVIPTLKALSGREDVLVVATTVVIEPETLGVEVPGNARVAKFVPYDLLMPLTDVLINNGGYGAVMQSLKLGIPLVVGGIGQDKDLTNIIVDMNEVGINLGTPKPTVDQLRSGAVRVLDDPKYKANALAMSRNFARYDVGQVFDGVIQIEARTWQQDKKMRNK